MTAMGLKIYAGRTFHIPTPPANVPHLWVATTDPDGTPEEVVMVNLTTQKQNSDTTVVLNSEDHRFINRPTVVYYADAKFVKVIALQDVIKTGLSRFDEDCSSQLLEKIQLGFLKSPFTPNKIKAYFREWFQYF